MSRNKLILTVILMMILSLSESSSKEITFRVFFVDKGPEKFEIGSKLYKKTLSQLSDRAVERRLKVRSKQELINVEDSPIYQDYIDTIVDIGVTIIHKLNWENYCVFKCDSSELDEKLNEIKKLSFVSKIQLTGEKILSAQSGYLTTKKRRFKKDDIYNFLSLDNCKSFNYGESYFQSDFIGANKLHRLGITGDSILIGIIDSGFRWETHNSMSEAKVIAEYDFIQLDSNTANEKDDIDGQDGHGTLVFSTISGLMPGKLIGISPTSSYILCKTEYIPNENRLEEDNYAAAIEWLERMGADISTSSLAYLNFEEPDENYIYSELTGNTTITARVINKAVSRGMICLTAAGNKGPDSKTLLSPGDADSSITLGAVYKIDDEIIPAGFTSRGPRADGRIKPDVSALGVQVVCAGTKSSSSIFRANGTSLSTPLAAGAVALLLSIFPELNTYQIRDLLYSTADNYPEKDDTTGYGNINIWKAARKAGIIISPPVIYTLKNYKRIIFHIVPDSYFITEPELLVRINGKDKTYTFYETNENNQYAVDIPIDAIDTNTVYAKLLVMTSESNRSYPYDDDFFSFSSESDIIPCGINKELLPRFESDNKLFVYPSIIEKQSELLRINYELSYKSKIILEIYSADGKRYYHKSISEHEPGIINLDVQITDYPIGMYFVSVLSNKKREATKFIVIK